MIINKSKGQLLSHLDIIYCFV